MIVAILLSKSEIKKNPNGRSLHFKLEQRKISVFLDYLQKFNVQSEFLFDPFTLEGSVRPSIMLESILKNWVSGNRIQTIDPLTLRLNTYFIWIGLFAKKTLQGTVIPTNLDLDTQYTLSRFFHQQFQSYLIPGHHMNIKPFSPIMLQTIKSNRPIEESMELSYLTPEKEKKAIRELVAEWEVERSNYVH